MRAREGGEGGWDRGASPRASCEREMPAAARRRGTGRRAGGGRGGGDPGPRGEIPGSRATSRGRAGRPGPGSLPAPAPCPRRPARAEGPPRAPPRPRGLRAPPPPAPPPAGCLPGPEPVRCPAACSGPRGELGEWGFRERRGSGPAEKERRMPVSLGARCWDKRSEGTRATCRHGLPRQPQAGEPLPPHPCASLQTLGARPPGPHTLPPPLRSFALEGPAPHRGCGLGLPRGLGAEAEGGGKGSPASRRRGERLITPGSPGMPGSWRPLRPPGTSRACSPLPSGTSLPVTAVSPGERL